MSTLIFRTAAPLIVAVMLVFAAFVLLRGHNEPGGGFIAGLIASAAIALYALAAGSAAAAQALRVPPLAIAGAGIFVGAAAGLLPLAIGAPFLTALWAFVPLGETEIALSTPQLFDCGVFLAVFGTITAVLFDLETSAGEG
ncbi:MAG: MnhB domain-containing protein [Devosia sp.]|nr:MnhB domain-containing protein [Devosia sp.]